MAVVFTLVVNFGDDLESARGAAATAAGWPPLKAGHHRIPLHPATITSESPEYAESPAYAQLSVLPVAVGFGAAPDRPLPRIGLTSEELTELGHGLYDLLAKFDGYQAAMVGWDPDSLVDTTYLRTDLTDELANGSPGGLVVSESLHRDLGMGRHFAPFAPGFVWIPWQGVKPSTLTVDRPS
ncbi:hypothetical protein HUT16_10295 [Kitasatospora sp. NA04385]|uniref:hypothetical protein n=1 Tax=Kitasatospora sp. NA04385 TaxID=2742135 RepID=UPI00159145B9|nr:hypothetical protein [Kitasatospora sp. NA04385]QKW19409.1 hypothetical protein HUT16_10295 [Kitasatospora sp. NA04385]